MTMNEAIEKLMTAIKDDYRAHTWTDWMIERFEDGLTFKEGKKYIKIFSEGGSVWGFVVNTDKDNKFRKGDILKAAGYNAPARNQARGNILDGDYTIEWTGPLYLN